MPINPIVLQQRHAELGRIRIGDQVATNNGGTRPNKLTHFRFTSGNEGYIRELAATYGGEAKAWKNGSKNEWEVYTQAKSIPVVVLKSGLSQWMEYWSGGGCIHRCDGVTNVLTDEPCDVNEQVKVGRKTVNPHTEAKPTTRVSMMLADLDAIGAWRLETHGWNAAAEIPAVAELAAFVGSMVPAVLHLMERTSVKDGKTSQFVVPVLDLKIGAAQLNQIVAAKMNEPLAITGGQAPALAAAPAAALPATGSVPDYMAQAKSVTTADEVKAIWRTAQAAGHMTDFLSSQLKVVADALVPAAPAGPDADGAYEAEVVTRADEDAAAAADAVWFQIVAEAGKHGMTGPQVQAGYSTFAGGLMPTDASEAELQAYLDYLRGAGSEQVPA